MRPPLGLIGSRPPMLDLAVLDGLPRLAGSGQPDVVDREVLARREAVVHLERRDVVEGDPGAAQRVVDGAAHVGHHVRVLGTAGQFLLQAQADRAVPPPVDTCRSAGPPDGRVATRR